VANKKFKFGHLISHYSHLLTINEMYEHNISHLVNLYFTLRFDLQRNCLYGNLFFFLMDEMVCKSTLHILVTCLCILSNYTVC